ncbi:cell surface glycoprotein [Halostagnicola sp. A-GB9-2]|uniref:cell surface glycoprotein n=1 Tax=Halostagnicola sp. A-GB9-2 TaxID=3048066 RepID=UPI0024BFF631|nr:cell surface glycoprotein [Halostagnicola sp. A-GB9-2]MDJ1434831.1 cell surface glycoprotein [Halostagnicola sp. A-GB9-2]
MHRRKLLAGSGVTLTTIIAGCTGDADDEDGNETENGDGEGPAEDTPEPDDNGEDDTDEANEEDEQPRSDDQLLSLVDTLEDDEPLFDPDTRSFDGSGQTVTDEFSLEAGLTAVTFDHSGEGYFVITLEGQEETLLVNEVGDVTGAAAIPTEAGDYTLEVEADGEWEIHVGEPISPEDELRAIPVQASGTGDAVVGPVKIEDDVTVEGEHTEDGTFIVTMYDESDSAGVDAGETVFSQIEAFEGETRATHPGVIWIDVVADGEWSLALE